MPRAAPPAVMPGAVMELENVLVPEKVWPVLSSKATLLLKAESATLLALVICASFVSDIAAVPEISTLDIVPSAMLLLVTLPTPMLAAPVLSIVMSPDMEWFTQAVPLYCKNWPEAKDETVSVVPATLAKDKELYVPVTSPENEVVCSSTPVPAWVSVVASKVPPTVTVVPDWVIMELAIVWAPVNMAIVPLVPLEEVVTPPPTPEQLPAVVHILYVPAAAVTSKSYVTLAVGTPEKPTVVVWVPSVTAKLEL